MKENVFNLKMHETLSWQDANTNIYFTVIRVVGGWIYRTASEVGVASVFVPLSEALKEK